MDSKPGPKIGTARSGFTIKELDLTPVSPVEPSLKAPSETNRYHEPETDFNENYSRQLELQPRLEDSHRNSGIAEDAYRSPSMASSSHSSKDPRRQPSLEDFPRVRSMRQRSDGLDASSQQTRQMEAALSVRQFIATKYIASSEKQREIIISNFKYFIYLLALTSPFSIFIQITGELSTVYRATSFHNLVLSLILCFLWFSTWLRKKYIREIIGSLNYMISFGLLGFILDFKFGDLDSRMMDQNYSRFLMIISNFQPIIFMNIVLVCFLTESTLVKNIFIGLAIVFMQVILALQAGTEFFSTLDNVFYYLLCLIFQWFFSLVFARTLKGLDEEKFRFMLQQSQENEMFKRVIDAVEDAMIIVSDTDEKQVTFKNKSAIDLFFFDEGEAEEILACQQIYLYSRDKDCQEEVKAISLKDLVTSGAVKAKHQIFTRHRDIGTCTSMAQSQMITQLKERKVSEGDTLGFDFFLVKLIRLQENSEAGMPSAKILQLVDISEKVYNDSLASEQKYLTYIMATVSHEMRNPLNSLLAQLANQATLAAELKASSTEQVPTQRAGTLINELSQSIAVAEAAAKLLDFNVENIVSLPKLKDKKFQKSYSAQAINGVIEEVEKIVAWTAEQRGIDVTVSYSGFDDDCIILDKKRVQQVLLNYLSNAIKFTDKQEGMVAILASLVTSSLGEQAAQNDFEQWTSSFYSGVKPFSQASLSPVGASRAHPPNSEGCSIFKFEGEPVLVISVIDNGVGIEYEAQQRLYNLFSGLQQGEQFQAKGIGLGVVVSSLIASELGGSSTLFSKPEIGSCFQSSFKVRLPQADHVSAASLKYDRLFLDGFPQVTEIESLPATEVKEFLQHFLERQNSPGLHRKRKLTPGDDGLKRILIIDDEPYNCLALLTLLKSLGLKNVSQRVDLCMGGREAIKSVVRSICPGGELLPRETSSSPTSFIVRPQLCQRGGESTLEQDKLAEELLEAVRSKRPVNSRVLNEALPSSNRLQSEYGLILSDCSMPFVDGYEFTKCARLLFEACGMRQLNSQPRIVAITGHFEPEFQMKAILSGMEKVFPKPMPQDELARLLEEAHFEFHK